MRNTESKVLIFGSCVTRDPFDEIVQANYGFEIKDYFARSSFASIAGSPMVACDLSNITSPFQRKMVDRDFSKQFLDYPFENIDLIIFDFIDDRLSLFELEVGSTYTESDEFQKSLLKFDAKKIPAFSNEFFARWEVGWSMLFDKFKSLNMLHTVLINKVFLANSDQSGEKFEHLSYINIFNSWLNRVYERLSTDLLDHQFIQYKDTPFIADASHKWGRSPYHYTLNINDAFIKNVIQYRNARVSGCN